MRYLLFCILLLSFSVKAQTYDEQVSNNLKQRYNTLLNSDDKKRVKKLQSLVDSIQSNAPQYIKICEKCSGTLYYMVSSECKRCRGTGTIKHNICEGSGKLICYQCEGKKIYNDPVCLGTGKEACNKCKGKGQIENDCGNCLGSGKADCYMCHGRTTNCQRCKGTGKDLSFATQSTTNAQSIGVNCSSCSGSGKTYCLTCNNSGKIKCQNCSGSGKIYNHCGNCGGSGFLGKCPTGLCKSGKMDCTKCDINGKITCNACKDGYVKCNGYGGSCGDGTTTYKMECGFCNGFGKELK
ncbi:MAG: hypothetical protein POELPBGB_02831 [Bacteroidia bacterium]|nr:hypothetical protein [Bacteroidia bacterium]